jgi:hypothetical protein
MLRESPSTSFTGPALIRLLTRLGGPVAAAPAHGLADGLGEWLGWTDAISLSAALESGTAALPLASQRAGCEAAERDLHRVRSALAKTIALATPSSAPARPGIGQPAPVAAAPDSRGAEFSPYRQEYLARQKAMESSIGALRGRLRDTLCQKVPSLARLAAVDAVMEQVVGPREQALLSRVPGMLEKHFERLRAAHAPAAAEAADVAAPRHAGEGWLRVFEKDLNDVLLAELDIRMQPVEGLLDALRMRPSAHDE